MTASEDLATLVGKGLQDMVAIIHAGGGEVIKFAGDSIFSLFPTSAFCSRGAAMLAACQVARELVALDIHPTESCRMTVHCGVAFGTAHGFLVGGVYDRWEYVITGSAIDGVCSAESIAGPGEVVLHMEDLPILVTGVLEILKQKQTQSGLEEA